MKEILLIILVAIVFFVMGMTTFKTAYNSGVQAERTRIWAKLNYCI